MRHITWQRSEASGHHFNMARERWRGQGQQDEVRTPVCHVVVEWRHFEVARERWRGQGQQDKVRTPASCHCRMDGGVDTTLM